MHCLYQPLGTPLRYSVHPWASVLFWCAGIAFSAPAQPASGQPARDAAGVPPTAISAITIERGCFGCAAGSALTLRRDGTATDRILGNARFGTADKTVQGTLGVADFDCLAREIIQQGFFALLPSYEDPQLRDGAWTLVTVTAGAASKQVFSREEAGPPALQSVRAALEQARARVRFSSDPNR